jgi:hypothetical protein
MDTPRTQPSPADVAAEVASLSGGVGILALPLFPFALPALLLAVAPLIPVALAVAVLAIPIALPVWLLRAMRRER